MCSSLRGLVAVLAAVVLALGAAAAGAQSGKVVWYNANGAKLGDATVKAFNATYPDVSIEMIVAGSGELLARIKSEQEHPRGDVYNGSFETMAAALHLFDSYRTKEHDRFPPLAVGPEYKYYGDSLSLQVVMVNTDLIALGDAPKSWKDLGDPRYKGKIVMANPSLSGSAYSQVAQMVQLYGWDLVEKVIENTIFVPKSRMVYTQVSRGEIPIGVTEESQPFLEAQKGFNVKPVYLEEGTGMRFGAVAIIKGGPNPDNARLFVDFLNSAEGHAIGVKVRQRRSPRSDVDPPEGIGMPPTSEVKLFPYDGTAAAENRQANLKRFDELFSGKR